MRFCISWIKNDPDLRYLYTAWKGIRYRCQRESRKEFHYYGGRGIKVCQEWDSSFLQFVSDIGLRPTPLHTIDRKDNDGDYTKDNCRWATRKEQQRNTRKKKIEFNGEMLCIGDIEKRIGLSQGTLWHRLKTGWPLQDALHTPQLYRRPKQMQQPKERG